MKTMDIKFIWMKVQISCAYFCEDGHLIFFLSLWYSKSIKNHDEQFETLRDNVVQSGSSTQRTTVMNMPIHKTFKDLFPQPQSIPLISAGPMLYEDTMKFRVSWVSYKDKCLYCLTFLVYRSLPTTCEVDDHSSRDALLSDDYDKLPPLRFVIFCL